MLVDFITAPSRFSYSSAFLNRPVMYFYSGVDSSDPSSGAVRVQDFWLMCWFPNMAITCLYTGKVRYTIAMGLIWIAPPWPTGLANPPRCLSV